MKKTASPSKTALLREVAVLRQRVAELENGIENRRTIEDALKASEEGFTVIFDNLGDGLLLADRESRKFLMGNSMIHRMLGYTVEELHQKGVADIHPEQDLPWVIDRFEELARKEIEIARDIPVRRKDGSVFYADISCSFPMASGGRECLMAVFRDISDRRQAQESLREVNRSLEQRIDERTQELTAKTRRLEELNTALKVLLEQRDEDRENLEQAILGNVKKLIAPFLEKLKTSGLNSEQTTYLEILESHLDEITSQFVRKLTTQLGRLTTTEVQVANLIREGRTTKEIARILHSSEYTVMFHRYNLRRKLQVKGKKINLRAYLQSIIE